MKQNAVHLDMFLVSVHPLPRREVDPEHLGIIQRGDGGGHEPAVAHLALLHHGHLPPPHHPELLRQDSQNLIPKQIIVSSKSI